MPKYVVGFQPMDIACIDGSGLKLVAVETPEEACRVAFPEETEIIGKCDDLLEAFKNYAVDGDCILVLIDLDDFAKKE